MLWFNNDIVLHNESDLHTNRNMCYSLEYYVKVTILMIQYHRYHRMQLKKSYTFY